MRSGTVPGEKWDMLGRSGTGCGEVGQVVEIWL